jgi:hypothetical protein
MLVIVDAQPFSTADAAATRGAIVEPFPFANEPPEAFSVVRVEDH